MGLVLALMVFVYPLALPVLTVGALFYSTASLDSGVSKFAFRASVVISALALLLGPGVTSGVSGSFLLPWWLHVAVGHSGIRFYVWQYSLACVTLLAILITIALAWRALARFVSRRK
jgi:hypothetical protein